MEEEHKRLPRQPKGKLTHYKRKLIHEYLKDYNGTQALIRIGYQGKRPGERAYSLLHLPEVEDEIERQEEMILKSVGVNKASLLAQLAKIGYSDIAKIFNDDGTLKDPKDIDDATRAAIGGIEILEEWGGRGEARIKIAETKKIKLRDSVEALKTLAKHLKLTGEEKEGATKVLIQVLIKGRDVPFDDEVKVVTQGSDKLSLLKK